MIQHTQKHKQKVECGRHSTFTSAFHTCMQGQLDLHLCVLVLSLPPSLSLPLALPSSVSQTRTHRGRRSNNYTNFQGLRSCCTCGLFGTLDTYVRQLCSLPGSSDPGTGVSSESHWMTRLRSCRRMALLATIRIPQLQGRTRWLLPKATRLVCHATTRTALNREGKRGVDESVIVRKQVSKHTCSNKYWPENIGWGHEKQSDTKVSAAVVSSWCGARKRSLNFLRALFCFEGC